MQIICCGHGSPGRHEAEEIRGICRLYQLPGTVKYREQAARRRSSVSRLNAAVPRYDSYPATGAPILAAGRDKTLFIIARLPERRAEEGTGKTVGTDRSKEIFAVAAAEPLGQEPVAFARRDILLLSKLGLDSGRLGILPGRERNGTRHRRKRAYTSNGIVREAMVIQGRYSSGLKSA
jgi:hypothetical protein